MITGQTSKFTFFPVKKEKNGCDDRGENKRIHRSTCLCGLEARLKELVETAKALPAAHAVLAAFSVCAL